MFNIVEMLKAMLFGIVEGITEWLPVSSTGHMVLLNQFVRMNVSEQFMSMFDVVIQLGAILAVIILFFRQIWPFQKPGQAGGIFRMDVIRLWILVVIAILPSAIVGIPLDDWMDAHLHNNVVIAIMLIVYGVLFIVVERSGIVRGRQRVNDLQKMDVRTAVLVGLFQVLALIPGTSRSGATIFGETMMGFDRVTAVVFSFFLAIPVMFGASLLKVIKYIAAGAAFSAGSAVVLLAGMIAAFAVSLVVINFMMDYIRKNNFSIFGLYRIALGIVMLVFTAFGVLA